MEAYLARFREDLRRYNGSLVRVASVASASAKEYLSKLAKEGAVERVDWGWYYVPRGKAPDSPFEFLAEDRNFKVVTGQTAASVWNGDFIHRDIVTVTVEDPSFKRALEAFATSRGWRIEAEHDPRARKIPAKRVGGSWVETPEATVVDCFQRWAFTDAVAILSPTTAIERLKRESCWTRIHGTDVRVGQALEYAMNALFGVGRTARISDSFVRRGLDEAIEKVREFE